MRLALLPCLTVWTLAAGAIEPKPKAGDYPAHAQTAAASIGAEFLGRYLPGEKTSYMTGDYMVVEVGFYPAIKGNLLSLRSGDFRLRLNGKRDLATQSPGIVAGALRNPHWEHERGVTTSGGIGPAVIVVRPERRQPRFPGDPESRPPAGDRSEPRIKDENQEQDAGDAAIRRALVDGQVDRPVAGLLYFAWDEPIRKLKSVDLVYEGPAGKLVIPLK